MACARLVALAQHLAGLRLILEPDTDCVHTPVLAARLVSIGFAKAEPGHLAPIELLASSTNRTREYVRASETEGMITL
jgi:hypothetical protein